MAVKIEEIIENLETLFDEGITIPLSSGKRIIDIDIAGDLMDDLKLNLPQEILQAKAIVQDRTKILKDAQNEADRIIKEAENRARAILAKDEITRRANEYAKEVTSNANMKASQVKMLSLQQSDKMLIAVQEQLTKNLNEVKKIREVIKKS